MRVMTFNLRREIKEDQQNWTQRKTYAFQIIQAHQPEIIGFQEVMPHMYEDLKKELFHHYDYFGEFRSNDSDTEMEPIFFNKNSYTLIDAGSFMLSENPDEDYSIGWDAAFPRIASWVKLHNNEQKPYYIINCHFDHIGTVAREESSKLILEKITELTQEFSLPAIIMGDFNTLPTEGWLDPLLNSRQLNNSYNHLKQTNPHKLLTFHEYKGTKEGLPIDHIFSTKDLEIQQSQIIRDEFNGCYPSDHYPVIVDFE
ncbi:endonuclease/exonuclease/phosphatase family protein [Fundicoccus culcitae]|uniref:Endonuclease/exonuclease/phosphatase family protein n=1 Tax=Fundicoccus culcitae TaxID=2969821 RepID=A0ABY5P6U4_9LACT|nr:endonuclease/exonuclease/phosphatase family protein [Fundicoccus culcitae]UUX34399.1 endonuclease/exonuclease/phosphatase family protein [Fundicoccus culcitae]